MGHAVLQLHGPECPGDCPGVGCFEALVSGNAIGQEGLRIAEVQPDRRSGGGWPPRSGSTAGS